MIDKDKQYCSLATPSLEMAGTADPVDIWLMLEYPISWKAKVLEDNQLSKDTRQWLTQSIAQLQAKGLKVRPQFIRQPEYDRSSTRFIFASETFSWQLAGQGYDFLHRLELPKYLKAMPSGGIALDEPLYFVCMNGQRDRCCARFGRPIYSALRERFAERVWQVNHLGGHRFAPNVLSLPQGAVYGRLTEENVGSFADRTEGGELHFESLRGVAWHSKPVQAAQVFARQQGLDVLRHEIAGDGSTQVVFGQASGEPLTITVAQASDPVLALASCKDDKPKPVHPYVLIK